MFSTFCDVTKWKYYIINFRFNSLPLTFNCETWQWSQNHTIDRLLCERKSCRSLETYQFSTVFIIFNVNSNSLLNLCWKSTSSGKSVVFSRILNEKKVEFPFTLTKIGSSKRCLSLWLFLISRYLHLQNIKFANKLKLNRMIHCWHWTYYSDHSIECAHHKNQTLFSSQIF